MQTPLITSNNDLLLEIFNFLLFGLNEKWQFETLHSCLLVCKDWHQLLNYNASPHTEHNLWRLFCRKNNISFDPNDNSMVDMRKILCENCIPSKEVISCESLEFNSFAGVNYQSHGSFNRYKMNSAFGIGLLAKMIKIDSNLKEMVHGLVRKITKCMDTFTCIVQDSSVMEVYGQVHETAKESMRNYPGLYYGRTFEDVKEEFDLNLYNHVANFISGHDKIVISDPNELTEFIKKECPLVVEYKNCSIGTIFSMAFVFFTKKGEFIYFEFSADN